MKFNIKKYCKGQNIVLLIVILILSSLVFTFVKNDFDRNRMSVFGFQLVFVTSESMEPEVHKYQFGLAKRVKFQDIKLGDIVSFKKIDDKGNKKIVMHRVVAKTSTNLITKGDNNSVGDEYQPKPEDVISKLIVF